MLAFLHTYHTASLRIVSAILTNIAAILLIELMLTRTWVNLATNIFLYILLTIAATQVEKYLEI